MWLNRSTKTFFLLKVIEQPLKDTGNNLLYIADLIPYDHKAIPLHNTLIIRGQVTAHTKHKKVK